MSPGQAERFSSQVEDFVKDTASKMNLDLAEVEVIVQLNVETTTRKIIGGED